jgi:hypothetical protein
LLLHVDGLARLTGYTWVAAYHPQDGCWPVVAPLVKDVAVREHNDAVRLDAVGAKAVDKLLLFRGEVHTHIISMTVKEINAHGMISKNFHRYLYDQQTK